MQQFLDALPPYLFTLGAIACFGLTILLALRDKIRAGILLGGLFFLCVTLAYFPQLDSIAAFNISVKLRHNLDIANQYVDEIKQLKESIEKQKQELDQKLLDVEQQAANRDITPKEMEAVSSKLIKFAGQRAEVVEFPVSFEHDFIASLILAMLSNAHWNAGPVDRLMSPPDNMLVQGIWIRATGDEPSQTASRALFDALKLTVAAGGFDPSPLPNPTVPRVWIFVGDKPTPLRSWVKP